MNKIYYREFNSPIGNIKVVGTSKAICYVWIIQDSFSKFEKVVSSRFGSKPIKDRSALKEAEDAFQRYFDGTLKRFDLPLDISTGTQFQKRVWTVLKDIPFGQVRSYKWVAEKTGNPCACRAVGSANGKNPIPVIIPCHRVVRTNGNLGGFSSGIDIKKSLLRHEGAPVLEQ
ncbi:MAG: methylated-DNA--[protein]-cysteine S-methyltransferase [Candidatus Anammoxibacter sp.]